MPAQEDAEQLRQMIRELGLNRLDEEIQRVLVTGKLTPKKVTENKRLVQGAFEQVPYSDTEQLNIVIKSLRAYFIELPLIQQEAEAALKESLQIKEINFFLTDDEDSADAPTATAVLSNDTERLNTLLNQIPNQ